jgi:hypothetical protein
LQATNAQQQLPALVFLTSANPVDHYVPCRSVIARFRDNERPDEVVKEQAQKLADKADSNWTGLDKVRERSE